MLRLQEAIARLKKDPRKSFWCFDKSETCKLEINKQGQMELTIRRLEGQYDRLVVWDRLSIDTFNPNSEWLERPLEVSWEDALNAWISGRHIFFKDEFGIHHFDPDEFIFKERNSKYIKRDYFVNGAWFIRAESQTEKEPLVTYQEAAKAFADFKRVQCEVDDETWTYDHNVTGARGMVAIEDGNGVSPLEITDGKWYIRRN